MGWESASGFDAPERYWVEGLGSQGVGDVGGGRGGFRHPPLVCERPVELSVEGVAVGRVLSGGRVVSAGAHDVVPVADWLSAIGWWTASTVESCVPAD